MKRDMVEMKKILSNIIQGTPTTGLMTEENEQFVSRMQQEIQQTPVSFGSMIPQQPLITPPPYITPVNSPTISHHEEVVEESLSLEEREKELIIKALEKYRGRRKNAATELGISERTLYRKIKEYGIYL